MIAVINWFDVAACVLAGFGAGLILRPVIDARLGLRLNAATRCSCGFRADVEVRGASGEAAATALEAAWSVAQEKHARQGCAKPLEIL